MVRENRKQQFHPQPSEAYLTYQPAPANISEKKYPISHLVQLQKSKKPKNFPDVLSNYSE